MTFHVVHADGMISVSLGWMIRSRVFCSTISWIRCTFSEECGSIEVNVEGAMVREVIPVERNVSSPPQGWEAACINENVINSVAPALICFWCIISVEVGESIG